MKHELKTWPEYFEAVFNGTKTFELRLNDRDYKVGDTLVLKEFISHRGFRRLFSKGKFTGRQIEKEVTYILEGGAFGLEKGHVIMGLK